MYFPIFKGRRAENLVIREYNDIFLNNPITPVIEVIDLGKKTLVELISYYDEIIKTKYFIDFFAFEEERYIPYDGNKVKFSSVLNTEIKYSYLNDLLIKTKDSKFAIPVISIKEAREFLLDENKIENLISALQQEEKSIAVRIEAHLFDEFFNVINKTLRVSDYFFFDIGSEPLDSFVFQIEDLNVESRVYNSIILNSPRKRNIYNSTYEKNQYTNLIDNKVALEYKSLGFKGFGDYLGLTDELPKVRNSKEGDANAHTLFYNKEINRFYSALNDNNSGLPGFKEVYRHLIKKEEELNKDNDCLAYQYLTRYENAKKFGNWATWKQVLMIRTLSEMKKNYR